MSASRRLFGIADLHGDLDKAHEALHLCGLIGPNGSWTGGTAVLVQTGDLVDRTVSTCQRIFKEAGTTKHQVDEVLLVGGQSRMPLVQEKEIEYKGGLVPDYEMQHGGCSKRKRSARDPGGRTDVRGVEAPVSRAVYEPTPEVARAMKKRCNELRAKAKRMAGK